MAKKKRSKKLSKKQKKSKTKLWGKYHAFVFLIFLWGLSNIAHQVYRHPSILFLPISVFFNKTVFETYESYGDVIHENAGNKIDPFFMASLIQVESMGNPLATTYWSFNFLTEPWKMYAPASTATGLLQVTKPTWDTVLKYCQNAKASVRNQSCNHWFGSYRVFPSHAIELTSFWFKKHLSKWKNLSSRNARQTLAVLHLCGPAKAKRFIRNSFHWGSLGRCGSHSPSAYYSKVERQRKRLKSIINTNYRLAKVY
ncbi:MAG: hypothetical protein VX642_08880 [Bdellovibrionota bacterium]|nr:hypothetical protein [Bdellovibrionota bacterium]